MDGSPQRWWQWVLMYPTIAVALAGAVPQYYVRRIQRSDNSCVDETIAAYTGRRLDQKQAPCMKF